MQHRFRKVCCTSLRLILLGLILVSFAAPVYAAGEEETVARNFLQFLRSDKTILSSEVLQGNLLDPSLPPVTIGYLFHLDGGGYLLVSPDRSISPVKAYSLAGDFAALPEPYRKALLNELELRARVALAGAVRSPLDAGMTETEKQWTFLLGFDTLRMPLAAYTPGAWLLRTRWNQTYPYNKFLPAAGGQTVVAGCVNVAVAQVMRHHRYPASARGVVSYDWTPLSSQSSQRLKTILYRNFNWDNMPDAVDATTPEYQTDEVALLLRDLGIANHTAFDASGSSTSLQFHVLIENFGYSTALAEMNNSVYTAFISKLQEEIREGRPVLLTFPGHMTVVDGYSADNAGEKIHVNMGWGGSEDNFYFLNGTPVQAGDFTFPTDAAKLGIHYNIKPCSGSDCYVNLESGDGIDGLNIAGNFDFAGDKDTYEVYLKGPTTVMATRGYGNIAFFISVINAADGSEVFPPPDPGDPTLANSAINAGDLPLGKYLIRVSLCYQNDQGTSCWDPASGYDHFTVNLTSGNVTAEERASLEGAPVIGSVFPDLPLPDLLLNTASATRRILIDARDKNGDPVALQVGNSNPAAVGVSLNGNILELTPTGTAKVSSRIVVTATANGKATEKTFIVLTDDSETAFGKSFTVGGIFVNNSDDFHRHRVILDGACLIHGDNGFTTQGFYSSVLTEAGNVLIPATAPPTDISGNFSRGVHQLGAALYMASGGYIYSFTTGVGSPYALMVGCPNADTSTQIIASLLGINLAGANLSIVLRGDVNGDGKLDLADAILALQIHSRIDTTAKTIILQADADEDGKIGFAEALFILQRAVGLRSP